MFIYIIFFLVTTRAIGPKEFCDNFHKNLQPTDMISAAQLNPAIPIQLPINQYNIGNGLKV